MKGVCENEQGQGPYRVGRHQPRNLYRGEQYIGVMLDPADTAVIMDRLNGGQVMTPNGWWSSWIHLHLRDIYVGIMFDPADAVMIARTMNGQAAIEQEPERFRDGDGDLWNRGEDGLYRMQWADDGKSLEFVQRLYGAWSEDDE